LLWPLEFGRALPINAPPLHARFLGAMYLSGATFMVLATFARQWRDVRVTTAVLALWTGLLGVVSILNLHAFDWNRDPTWFWFFAYLGFPMAAAWLAGHQRRFGSERRKTTAGLLAASLLVLIGGSVTVFGVVLLFAPTYMVTLWPWALTPLLAQVYSAPFVAFGLGLVYAASQSAFAERRIAILGSLVFAVGALVASYLHFGLFRAGAPSTLLWFGGFGLAGLALIALLGLSRESKAA
jgi:hypothetical protein